MTLGRHDVAEQRQMAVVDVRPVERDDVVHLTLDRLAHGLDAETREDFNDVVGGGADRIDVLF
jgi:hypothetical protein